MTNRHTYICFFYLLTNKITYLIWNWTDKVLDAAESAEKQALFATSKSASRMISNRYYEMGKF